MLDNCCLPISEFILEVKNDFYVFYAFLPINVKEADENV